MADMLSDIRHAIRALLQQRTFSLVAIAALALGIGANTAMFSVVYTVLLKPLPYGAPDRLVWIALANKRFQTETVSGPDFLDWRSQARWFDPMAAFMPVDQTWTGAGDPLDIRVTFCSESISRLFGAVPASGRDFLPEELKPGAQSDPVLLSDRFFRARFGGSRSAIGRSMVLNGQVRTIVGVLPRDFRLALPTPFGPQIETDVIVPFRIDPAIQRRNAVNLMRMAAMRPNVQLNGQPLSVQVLARLRPGVPLERARAELATVQSHLPMPPFVQPGDQALVLKPLRDRILGNTGRPLAILLGAVTFVLLIACANVANLLLVRAGRRRKEIALRMALGAQPARLMRQFLTESLVLAAAGGAAGILLAWWSVRLLVQWSPVMVPHLADAGLSAPVLAFAVATCALTGILFGAGPAAAAIREGAIWGNLPVKRGALRGLLVVSEVALALVLLSGAGLMVRSLWLMHASTASAAPDRVLTADLRISNPRFFNPANQREFLDEYLSRIEALPGVRAAAAVRGSMTGMVRLDQSGGEPVKANYVQATSHYFAAAGIRLRNGRLFGPDDRDGAPRVAIVNETLARRLTPEYPNATPVGRTVPLPPSRTPLGVAFPVTIVGVVADLRLARLDEPVEPELYLAASQDSTGVSELMVRASSDPTALIGAIAAQGREVTGVQLMGARTLAERLDVSIAPRRFQMALLVTFASLAVLLALVGIFGVVSSMVLQRTREIGIRVALGAQRQDVVRLVLGSGLRLVAAGVAIGLAGSFGLTRLMASLLYGVKATDLVTFAGVSAILVMVSAVAAWLPARRAAAVDPLVALKQE
jgi:putative ABC transport system permease protein